jgi:UDP-glucose 4-epimerase
MRILITGGAGFIGSHLVERFQDKSVETLFSRGWQPSHTMEEALAPTIALTIRNR